MPQLQAIYTRQSQALINKFLWPLLVIVATAGYLSWILYYSAHGVDFTDESFYLVWISDPFQFSASSTQFGFIYYPLYILFDGDVATLRQFNVLITYFLACSSTFCLLRNVAPVPSLEKNITFIVSAGFAATAMVMFDSWLLTPGYNSLAFQALMITVTGFLLTDKIPTLESLCGSVLIGLGCWLAFMAKPTTAVVLTIGVLLCLTLSRKLSFRTILIPLSTGLVALIIGILFIDGSVTGFVQRLQRGLELNMSLGGGHTFTQLMRLDDFLLTEHEKKSFLLLTLLTFFSNWHNFSPKKSWSLIARVFSSIFFVVLLGLVVICCTKIDEFGSFKHLLLLSVASGCAINYLCVVKWKTLSSLAVSHWVLFFFFLSMPHIYAFGTNGNYWTVGGAAGLFWTFAGLVLLGHLARMKGSWRFALPMVSVPLLISSVFLYSGMERPYRQPQPLWLNTQAVDFGYPGSELILSDSSAGYIRSVKNIADNAGFKPGTVLMDFSGQSPGIVYALRGRSPGQAWMIGGYPGSEARALAALKYVSCETVSQAWLLIEPGGPRSLNTDILSSFGLHFPDDFQSVGKWETSVRPDLNPPVIEQFLFKPKKLANVAMKACISARK